LISGLERTRWLLLAVLFGAFALAVACGSGDDSSGGSEGADAGDDLSEVSRTLLPDKTFTVDDFVAVGWKKSKQYDDISTVPEATEVYLGFFNAKDIEVRIYPSHDSALSAGVTDAGEDIDQSFREGGQFGASNRGAGSSAVTKFKAFAVIGNTVILCEGTIEACTAVADALGG
jgi:hypothetical protein